LAKTNYPVFVTGETGTGKELFAEGLHLASGRKGAFVRVNIAGFDDTMFSDALFGHRRGAFTGALETRPGFIDAAAEGTLFLDEIGEMRPETQVKLLRFLQDGSYYPLGSDQPRKSSARLVLATNRDAEYLTQDTHFRRDLFFRLRSHWIRLPALREHPSEIEPLFRHLLALHAKKIDRRIPACPVDIFSLLESYPFPGNVRELEGMIQEALIRGRDGEPLSSISFRRWIEQHSGKEEKPQPFTAPPLVAEEAREQKTTVPPETAAEVGDFPTLKSVIDRHVGTALQRTEGNISQAAQLLGVTRQALSKRLTRRKAKD